MLAMLLCGIGPLYAGEPEIRAAIRAFFQESDDAKKNAIARQIAADPAFQLQKMSEWIHAAGLHPQRDPGVHTLNIELRTGEHRTVHVRVPAGYDPARTWPLILAYHGSGGSGPDFIPFVEKMLEDRAPEYIIAAPTDYGQRVIHQGGPPSTEHLETLIAIREFCHIDSDRVFATGYSLGGHTAWTLAVMHPDQFAACIPLAGSLVLPDTERYFPDFLPNIGNTLVVACWGANDTTDVTFANQSPQGGIAGINRLLAAEARRLNIRLLSHEAADLGHAGVTPPAELLLQALAQRRIHNPRSIHHTFRNLAQAAAYWIEPRTWRGPYWGDNAEFKGTLRPDETPRDALAREVRKRLGRVEGAVDGQTLTLRRKNVDNLVVWIGDDMIRWDAPLKINHMGRIVFDEAMEPDVLLCLTQAQRTWDFDRLRWGGIVVAGGRKPLLLRGRDALPPITYSSDAHKDK